MDERTISLLAKYLPEFSPEPEGKPLSGTSESVQYLALPAPEAADYRFEVWEYSFGDRQIGAKLLDHTEPGEYFWYMPLEMAGFGNSAELVVETYLKELEILLTHDTRIIQKKGLLSWGFRCEYLLNGSWKRVYGHSAIRGGFQPPSISGREKVYFSPALSNSIDSVMPQ